MFENKLPLVEFDIFQAKTDAATPNKICIKIQARRAKLSDNPNIQYDQPNCWRYIRRGSHEEDGHDGHACNQHGHSSHSSGKLLDVFIGPILNVRRGVPLTIHFENALMSMSMPSDGPMSMPMSPSDGPMLENPPIHPAPMMDGMNPSVGVAVHLHGGKVQDSVDGWPLTPMSFCHNPYNFPTSVTYKYPNDQRAGMLWFHDHGMDNTAPQVHAGLAGLYFIRDESDDQLFQLLGGNFEIPLVIQDRIVNCQGNGVDYGAGFPAGRPEFLGDTIFVNGRPWPHHYVEQKRYRLRVLNGSNARTYALALVNPEFWTATDKKVWYSDKLTVIGNDGGLFSTSKKIAPEDYLVIAPGERLDLILDLTDVCPDEVPELRLVNLAVGSLERGEQPEGIFQHESKDGSIISSDNMTKLLRIKQANIMQFCISHNADHTDGGHSHTGDMASGHDHDTSRCDCQHNADTVQTATTQFNAKLDQLLLEYAQSEAGQDGFAWDGTKLGKVGKKEIVTNRFVVLMNNSQGIDPNSNPYVKENKWHDTQIWELEYHQPDNTLQAFIIPFDAKIGSSSPSAFNPTNYQVSRSTFFAIPPDPLLISKQNGAGFNHEYAPVAAASFTPKAGTYERWYVANIGNAQPADEKDVVDMHPFHMHLVNFVVVKRYVLDDTGNFSGVPAGKHHFDGEVRHDTVRVNSNELVELLVHFPEDYHGKYPYHCHLVEHEDMGMMLHFEVQHNP